MKKKCLTTQTMRSQDHEVDTSASAFRVVDACATRDAGEYVT